MSGLLESQYSILEALNITTSLLSLIGIICALSVMILVGVFGYKKKETQLFHTLSLHKLSFYIITFIFLADLLRVIGHLLPSPSTALPAFYSELSCRPGAFFKLFGSISTFLWMGITSYIVYKLLLYPHRFDKRYVDRLKRIFHCITWPVALLISVLPLAFKQYTRARSDGPYCFIDTSTTSGMVTAFFGYYLFLMLIFSLIVFMYVLIGKLLWTDYQKAKQYNADVVNIINHNNIITKVPTIQRLQFYPLIFIFSWFWEILSISYNKLQSNDVFILKVTQILFTNLYGLFNTILFFYVVYKYNSNEVVHRNPKTLGLNKKRKKKKKGKKQSSYHDQNGHASSKPTQAEHTTPIDRDGDSGGGDVQVTTTTKQRRSTKDADGRDGGGETKQDDLSGQTLSLDVGNVTVLSPTSLQKVLVTHDRMEYDPIVCVDEDDEDEEEEGKDEETVSEITDFDNAYDFNVTIGYNEDASDQVFCDDGMQGNICIEDNDDGDDDEQTVRNASASPICHDV